MNELDSLQELFELLQIKPGIFESSIREDGKRSPDDSSEWTIPESETSQPPPVTVKKETDPADDDDKEEGEIKDDDDDDDENEEADELGTSPNPVNLSITKTTDSDNMDKENEEVTEGTFMIVF